MRIVAYICDGGSTVGTTWRIKLVVILGAVGHTPPLKKGSEGNLFLAVITDEVLWVPRLP